ncbi:MAG: D-2-hydroxyacid dehydrogenase [Spirochaetaceae bacterium]|nr:MAG: D-2-hydroxyacid dehydrogenase [Spirochaetaceae bacterium]
MRIVVLDGYTLNPGDLSWDELKAIGEVEVHERTDFTVQAIVERADGAEIVLTNKTPLSVSVIDRLPSLRYVGVLATGFNVVDGKAAEARRIPVANIPTYGTDSVAQMTFAHLLNLCHHVAEHSTDVRSGAWARSPDFCYWLNAQIELVGRTLGIVGFGRIGRRVGEIANAFGMRVIAHDLHRSDEPNWPGFAWREIDELLELSDVVTLHCPLTPENTGMMDAQRIARMKRHAFLLNMSRGPLVVDADLADALCRGLIAGAGIDVLEQEPPVADNPLYGAPNVTITPHIAWATKQARARLLSTAVRNVRAFLEGSPQNVVNGVM